MIENNEAFVIKTISYYESTQSGKSWKSKPYKIRYQIASWEDYLNMTSPDAIRMIRSKPFLSPNMPDEYIQGVLRGDFGFKVTATVSNGYTPMGYYPVRITICQYDGRQKTKKIIEDYEIYDKYTVQRMYEASGYREREIMLKVASIRIDARTISFYTAPDSDGHSDGCQWDLVQNKWVG